MTKTSPIIVETRRADRASLGHSLDLLQGCWKSSSLLWMQVNGFPVLTGLIFSEWNSTAEKAVSRFCQDNGFSELLVRIEKPGQRWMRRRGGYTIPVSQAQRQVEELAAEEMLTILLEPASPYADSYSVTSVCDLRTGKLDLEIVGPGFDASDLLRADIPPHERFESLLRVAGPDAPTAFPPPHRTRVHLIGPDDYAASVQRRLAKIGARLRNPSFPDTSKDVQSADSEQKRLAEDGADFLRRSGETLLLDHSEKYEPIRSLLLTRFIGEWQKLFARAKAASVPWQTISLAASFLPGDRLTIWDFFVPGETDTSMLRRL